MVAIAFRDANSSTRIDDNNPIFTKLLAREFTWTFSGDRDPGTNTDPMENYIA